METRNPVEGCFGSKFSAIRKSLRSFGGLETQNVNNFREISPFLEKRTIMAKFSKFCSKGFHRDTDRRVVCKYGGREIGEIVRCLPEKKFRLALLLLDGSQNLLGS